MMFTVTGRCADRPNDRQLRLPCLTYRDAVMARDRAHSEGWTDLQITQNAPSLTPAELAALARKYASTWVWDPHQGRYVTRADGITTTDVATAITHGHEKENSSLAADYWVLAAQTLAGINAKRLAQAHAQDNTEHTFDSLMDLSYVEHETHMTNEALEALIAVAACDQHQEPDPAQDQALDTVAGPDPLEVQRVYDYLSYKSPSKPPTEVRHDAEYLVQHGYTAHDLGAFAAWAEQANTAYSHGRDTTGETAHDTEVRPAPDEVQRVYDYLIHNNLPHRGREGIWDHAEHLVGLGYTAQMLTAWHAQLDAYLAEEAAYQQEHENTQQIYDYLTEANPDGDEGTRWDDAERLAGLSYTVQDLTELDAEAAARDAEDQARVQTLVAEAEQVAHAIFAQSAGESTQDHDTAPSTPSEGQEPSSARATEDGIPGPATPDRGSSPHGGVEAGSGVGSCGDELERARRAITDLRATHRRFTEPASTLSTPPGVDQPVVNREDPGW